LGRGYEDGGKLATGHVSVQARHCLSGSAKVSRRAGPGDASRGDGLLLCFVCASSRIWSVGDEGMVRTAWRSGDLGPTVQQRAAARRRPGARKDHNRMESRRSCDATNQDRGSSWTRRAWRGDRGVDSAAPAVRGLSGRGDAGEPCVPEQACAINREPPQGGRGERGEETGCRVAAAKRTRGRGHVAAARAATLGPQSGFQREREGRGAVRGVPEHWQGQRRIHRGSSPCAVSPARFRPGWRPRMPGRGGRRENEANVSRPAAGAWGEWRRAKGRLAKIETELARASVRACAPTGAGARL